MKPQPFKVGTAQDLRINGTPFEVWLVPQGMVPVWTDQSVDPGSVHIEQAQSNLEQPPLTEDEREELRMRRAGTWSARARRTRRVWGSGSCCPDYPICSH